MHIVYKTTNLLNNKYYVGKHSCNRNCRKGCNYLGSGDLLKLAVQKYGEENFKRETLATFDTADEAYEYEKQVIDLDDPLTYNICGGGKGVGSGESHPRYGMTHSKETKRKMSESQSGERNPNHCKYLSQEYRAKISESQRGRACSSEVKEKISNKLKGRPRPPAVKVLFEGVTYPSMKAAARALGVSAKTVKKRLNRGVGEIVN